VENDEKIWSVEVIRMPVQRRMVCQPGMVIEHGGTIREKQFMTPIAKKIVRFFPFRRWLKKQRQKKEIAKWEKDGKPLPPPHAVKQVAIQNYSERFNLDILVETGTYYGDMVEAMRGVFSHIYSIELSHELYEKAKKRFKGEKQIELIWGDSGVEMEKIMGKLDQPALFWLDGHYSAGETARSDKDTPIYEELSHILNAKDRDNVVIIDDAHLFGEDPAYPGKEELFAFIKARMPEADIVVAEDSIRITPKPQPEYTGKI